MVPEDQKNMTTQGCSTGRLFTAATQALITNFYKQIRKYKIKQLPNQGIISKNIGIFYKFSNT